jgi:predicted transcriptional regulator
VQFIPNLGEVGVFLHTYDKINKDVSNIQSKVKKLEEEGFIKFENGVKNSKIPYLTFDEIKLEI